MPLCPSLFLSLSLHLWHPVVLSVSTVSGHGSERAGRREEVQGEPEGRRAENNGSAEQGLWEKISAGATESGAPLSSPIQLLFCCRGISTSYRLQQ